MNHRATFHRCVQHQLPIASIAQLTKNKATLNEEVKKLKPVECYTKDYWPRTCTYYKTDGSNRDIFKKCTRDWDSYTNVKDCCASYLEDEADLTADDRVVAQCVAYTEKKYMPLGDFEDKTAELNPEHAHEHLKCYNLPHCQPVVNVTECTRGW